VVLIPADICWEDEMSELELDIPAVQRADISWKALLDREGLLQLPAAHDALTAKLIERAGFPAYQVAASRWWAPAMAAPMSISSISARRIAACRM
jgi:2-methylisocitrate lyase-like PEP mutase family enzyme